jgi:Na+-transporting methylmalonyl-CoA/oxaloacetate decarboxylase gamma subunit
MNSFYKVVGIVRIIFMELMILIFFIGFISNLAKDLEEHTVSSDLSYLISTGIIGTLCMVWLVWTV